jgi:hypothetical protein
LENIENNKRIEIVVERNSPNRDGSSYSLNIGGTGKVEYNGLSNVKTLGKRLTKISTEDLNRIIHEFQDLYFFSFKDSYEPSNQSNPEQQIAVSLRLGDKYKSVKYSDGSRIPLGLKELVKEIEKITKVNSLSGIE